MSFNTKTRAVSVKQVSFILDDTGKCTHSVIFVEDGVSPPRPITAEMIDSPRRRDNETFIADVIRTVLANHGDYETKP